MLARLTAAQPLLAALAAEPKPSLSIVGINATTRLVWIGVRNAICFVLPPSINTSPKALLLWVGDGSGNYYPTGLGYTPIPADSQGCANVTVMGGVAVGPYTISLQDAALGRILATTSLYADSASLAANSFTQYSATTGAVTLSWSIPAGRASTTDAVWALNSKGAVVYWFYTSCMCQGPPGAAASPSGSFLLKVSKPAVAGGYTFELHPRNGAAMAAAAPNWIPWAKLGW
jgi:hypothetical protein